MSGDSVRWLILGLVLTVAGGGLYYQYEDGKPCVHPVVYSIGFIDPRFGTNATELTSDLAAAAAIWNKVAGKTLFALAPSGGVKVNLVYDDREQTAVEGLAITKQEASLDSMRVTLSAEHDAARTPQQMQAVNQDVEAFNAQVRTLNAKIADFNASAGHTFEEGEYVRDDTGERINVFEFVGKDQLERVLAHELGHAVGLDHNSNPDSIMNADNESGNLIPTADDIGALKALCGLR